MGIYMYTVCMSQHELSVWLYAGLLLLELLWVYACTNLPWRQHQWCPSRIGPASHQSSSPRQHHVSGTEQLESKYKNHCTILRRQGSTIYGQWHIPAQSAHLRKQLGFIYIQCIDYHVSYVYETLSRGKYPGFHDTGSHTSNSTCAISTLKARRANTAALAGRGSSRVQR